MKKKFFVIGFFVLFYILGCKQIQKATDFVVKPSAREIYERPFKDSIDIFQRWQQSAEMAIMDSLKVATPYTENGVFNKNENPVLSYNLHLSPGRILNVGLQLDHPKHLVFIELFKITRDSLATLEQVASSELNQKSISFEVKDGGIYKIRVQPELGISSTFALTIQSLPLYHTFPVAGKSDTAIQSFWGAARDGGKRKHEGIDIFAKRGTPVVAVNKGSIRYSGEKGLGGKQVWLRDAQNNCSLYYAHLDSITVKSGGQVKEGDTLGFVGNTGNASKTVPHLHFGIYKGFSGAVDPFPFLKQEKLPSFPDVSKNYSQKLIVKSSVANIRNSPTTKTSQILGTATKNDTLHFMGATNDWFHIETLTKQAGFIHKSLVKNLN
ncbi:M23 family metallopeptidase [Galbibacter sp. BG1]|uniref:M23 family metallopeptidase n=1 Tax=Galbibacter sp. BG1 TaxID=1170699 RepID=UPI0015BE4355|nr:M23 family metallopeptidase [Galbibacter sp. BG1]QLE00852.1 M23 family metallopeptidase [Galbibacter sp. BG1]